jgi:hypothetical protein
MYGFEEKTRKWDVYGEVPPSLMSFSTSNHLTPVLLTHGRDFYSRPSSPLPRLWI